MNTAREILAAAAILRRLVPLGVKVAAGDPRADHGPLPMIEAAALANARPARLREFSAGRVAARTAMTVLGVPPQPIPMGNDRAPCWPEGLTGSISHSATLCLAAVAKVTGVRAIGIDVEEDCPLAADLWPTICRDEERAWLQQQPGPTQGHLAKLLFCAKEAAYKAQYTLSGCLIDFTALRVRPNLDTGTYTAEFTRSVPPFVQGFALQGHFAVAEGHILAVVVVTAGD